MWTVLSEHIYPSSWRLRKTWADSTSVDSHQQRFLFSSLNVEEGKTTELFLLPITAVRFAWRGFFGNPVVHQFALWAPTKRRSQILIRCQDQAPWSIRFSTSSFSSVHVYWLTNVWFKYKTSTVFNYISYHIRSDQIKSYHDTRILYRYWTIQYCDVLWIYIYMHCLLVTSTKNQDEHTWIPDTRRVTARLLASF